MRFMTSAPLPVDHMIGSSPRNAATTVMAFGRTRLTAPWTMASCRSVLRAHPALPHGVLVGQIEEEQHEDAGLGVEAHQRDHADPHGDRHVVVERP